MVIYLISGCECIPAPQKITTEKISTHLNSYEEQCLEEKFAGSREVQNNPQRKRTKSDNDNKHTTSGIKIIAQGPFSDSVLQVYGYLTDKSASWKLRSYIQPAL